MKWTDNKIGNEGAAKISELLMTNTTLTKLYLCGDDNINESKKKQDKLWNVNIKRMKNEQVTILEQKELWR